MRKLINICIFIASITVTQSQECVIYDFESNFDELFLNDLQCANQNSWVNIPYEDLGISTPFANSSLSIQSTTASCSRTINFIAIEENGVIELTYYLGAVDGDLVNMNFMVMGMLDDGSTYFVTAFSASSSNTVNGWHTARFTLNSYVEAAYMVLFGNFQNQNSILLMDSFRYVQSEELLDSCELYDDEIDDTSTPAPEEDVTTATIEEEITTMSPSEETTATTEEETTTITTEEDITTITTEEEITTITTEEESTTITTEEESTTITTEEESTAITIDEETTTISNTEEFTTITVVEEFSSTTLESTSIPENEENTNTPQDELTTSINVEEFTTVAITDEVTTSAADEDSTTTSAEETTTNIAPLDYTTDPTIAEMTTITQESTNLPSNLSKGLRWWEIAAIILSISLALIIIAIVIYELSQRQSKKVFYKEFDNSSDKTQFSKPYLVPRVERAYANPADFFSLKKDASFYS